MAGLQEERAVRTSVLRASFHFAEDATRIADKYHTSPIKIAKSFPLKEQLGVIVMDASPGLLAGDRYELEWQAHRYAQTYITTQSYMKVHPSPLEGRPIGSSISQTFRLGDQAVIEHMPEPVMLYKEARLHSETNVYLGQGSVWMQADILCPGRTLRQEQFLYSELRNSISVYYGGDLIFAQRQRIIPGKQKLKAPGCWEQMTHMATFCLFTDRLTASQIEAMKQLTQELPSYGTHPVIVGLSETQRYGLVATAASTAAWPLQEAMRFLWHGARRSVLGKEPLDLLYS
ncbi:urease accessory protein UreD [Paenibacillus glycanilyticus]|uniref:urease accessory protein UreD n=1 Tax=Paenibacillus glycanilyticus TaxID=126569 RepID=UPI00203FE33F|nr:urease accessory protein UreD [Paenibacillus glycanilyticus]MCM3630183.1 urease accessory protein UreD [Paenibacillus glycanilyticus]